MMIREEWGSKIRAGTGQVWGLWGKTEHSRRLSLQNPEGGCLEILGPCVLFFLVPFNLFVKIEIGYKYNYKNTDF